MVIKLSLEKQNQQLQSDLTKAVVDNTDLKAQLNKAQLDLIAIQGKAIIDSSGTGAE